jgi:putative membrane protein
MLHALMLLSTLAAPAARMPVPPRTLTAADKTFLSKAAMGNNYELSAAKIAAGMATNDADKQYAQMMITDHTKLAADLTAAVAKNDPAFKMPAGIDAKQQNMLDALRKSGKAFAAEYKKQMIASHDEVKALFSDYTGKPASNADIKGVITGAMPTVDKHIAMANSLPMR